MNGPESHQLTCPTKFLVDVQIIDTFLDSVMSVSLTKSEIIAGSVDGTIRTFDIRIGRYVISIKIAVHYSQES